MNLLKIGTRYINFDLVRYVVEDHPKVVQVFFSGEVGVGSIVQLRGDEAEALMQWLRLHVTVIRLPTASWHADAPPVAAIQ